MSINIPQPTDMCIITTYRCPMRCKMCNIWEHPTDKRKEITPEEIKLLPSVKFINLTGGEPFIREDLEQIVEVCFTKSPRVVISTSGWYEDRVIALAKKFPNIGIRISIEGLSCKNDELRGHAGGFDKGAAHDYMGSRRAGVGQHAGARCALRKIHTIRAVIRRMRPLVPPCRRCSAH